MRVQNNFLIAYFGKRDKWTGLGLVHKAGSRFGKCFSNTGTSKRGGPYQSLAFCLELTYHTHD